MFLHYLAKLETQKLYHFRLQCVHRLQRRGARYQCSMACVSICLLDTTVSPAKTDEPIVVPFGLWTPVGQPNHALVGGPDPPGKDNFEGCSAPLKMHCNSECRKWLYKLYNI